jgi:tRNA A37 threonylcarbamoyladenosine dehydratase
MIPINVVLQVIDALSTATKVLTTFQNTVSPIVAAMQAEGRETPTAAELDAMATMFNATDTTLAADIDAAEKAGK